MNLQGGPATNTQARKAFSSKIVSLRLHGFRAKQNKAMADRVCQQDTS